MDYSAAYTLGALDGEELSESTSHLKSGCAICSSEIGLLTELSALLPSALRPLMVSPDLSERVLFNAQLAKVAKAHFEAAPAEAEEPSQEKAKEGPKENRERGKISWMSYALVAALLIMLSGFSLYVYRLTMTIAGDREYIAGQRTQIMRLADDLNRKEAVLSVLGARRVEVVPMSGLGVDSAAYGTLFLDPDKKLGILHVSNLPLLPQDKEYQLWIFKEAKKVSAGTFSTTDDFEKENFYTLTPLEISGRREIDSVSVTAEPKGGSTQPTGVAYLLGSKPAQ